MARGAIASRTISLDENVARAFHGRYPSASLRPTGLSTFPADVLAYLERKATLYILPESYRPKNFPSCALIHHDGEGLTYAATLQKIYVNDGKTENLIYLADIDAYGSFAGYGEVRFPSPPYDDRRQQYFPFVGYTETFHDFQRRGLGMRRLLLMDALSHACSGLPLQSGAHPVKNARSIWKSLVEKGLAFHVSDDIDRDYYRFTS